MQQKWKTKIGKGYSLPRCTNFPGTVQSNWKKGILLFSFVNSINVVLSDSGLSCLNIGGLSKHRVLKKVTPRLVLCLELFEV